MKRKEYKIRSEGYGGGEEDIEQKKKGPQVVGGVAVEKWKGVR